MSDLLVGKTSGSPSHWTEKRRCFYLDVAEHIGLDGRKGHRAHDIYRGENPRVSFVDLPKGQGGHDDNPVPNMVVKDSAASRNCVVAIALPLSASMGTLTKDCLKVCTMVPPGGMTGADMTTGFCQ